MSSPGDPHGWGTQHKKIIEYRKEVIRREGLLGHSPHLPAESPTSSNYEFFNPGAATLVVLAIVVVVVVVLYHVYGPTSSKAPQLASSYRGSIHQSGLTGNATFTLSQIKETSGVSSSGNIAGEASCSPELVPNGPFKGNITAEKSMSFTIGDFLFVATTVNSVKSLSGTYKQQKTNGLNGTWQLTETS
jgi:hypothetical protein